MLKYKRVMNVKSDVPDSRDWLYQPVLIPLKDKILAPDDLTILDQKSEGACTGFALAAAINFLLSRSNKAYTVSPRMLYEMARRHDEWPGEEYDGSSIRGAIHGWKYMGVCSETMWPYRLGKNKGTFSIDAAKDARKTTLGAYYRVHPVVSQYHAALNETGILTVSAKIHRGWENLKNGKINHQKNTVGGHAFVIVGYNQNGFWVQNSWGPSWGNHGIALWSYEDWLANVMDAWVFRLSLPTPQIFGLKPESSVVAVKDGQRHKISSTPRSVIAGHFVHIDDGQYAEKGRYWSTAEDVDQTAELVAKSSDYQHLLFYMHGGLNSPKDSAIRIAAMKECFKSNGIYPFHTMYDTGIVEELKDLILRKENQAEERVGGFSDWTDWVIEKTVHRPGKLLWEEMKRDAHDAFARDGAGTDAVSRFFKHLKKAAKKKKIHLVGHSTGAVVIAHLLKILKQFPMKIESCTLLAPGCTVELFHENYLPVLQRKTALQLKNVVIYNLKDELERDDHVIQIYRKSLLYLVSNALEPKKEQPLLGMERFQGLVRAAKSKVQFIYSNGVDGQQSRSMSHGGFDNDIYTMNHILSRILGREPKNPFTVDDLAY